MAKKIDNANDKTKEKKDSKKEIMKQLHDPNISEEKKNELVEQLYADIEIRYAEPDDYFPEEIRKEYKLGEYAEEGTLLQYKSYYVYDFKSEAVLVADGDEQSAAYNLYAKTAKNLEYDFDKWALDIALDCVRNFTDEEIADIKKQGEIVDFHFGYGMYVRNKYVHKSKKHFIPMADDVSSLVEKFIYAILFEREIEKDPKDE